MKHIQIKLDENIFFIINFYSETCTFIHVLNNFWWKQLEKNISQMSSRHSSNSEKELSYTSRKFHLVFTNIINICVKSMRDYTFANLIDKISEKASTFHEDTNDTQYRWIC